MIKEKHGVLRRESYWNFSKEQKVAWFDEDLDTWMRDCRGSGVMVKRKGKWKLAYYNLTVLIENEKMKGIYRIDGINKFNSLLAMYCLLGCLNTLASLFS